MGHKIVLFALATTIFLITTAQAQAQACESRYGPSGNISESVRGVADKCWKIHVPSNSFIRLNVTKLKISSTNCNYNFVKISVNHSGEEYKYCEVNNQRTQVTALNNVTVTFKYNNNNYNYDFSFELLYEILDVECSHQDSFRCSNYSCIPQSQVCDGIKQCKNGADEADCGVLAIRGVSESLKEAVSWMKAQRTTTWGWGEDTPRAVVALFLASAANFSGESMAEELMVKEAELRTAVALCRSPITNSDLAMLVNALLVTCHNPRHFFAKNLVKQLKEQVEATQKFTHPVAYLALCNANETWPDKAYDDLTSILASNSGYPFVRDIQAMAVMALSCIGNGTNIHKIYTDTFYKGAIRRFKTQQLEDGSFGNVHTTALITQALMASGEEQSQDWKLKKVIEYLMREINSTTVDFLSMYLTLPILNGKTFVDISQHDCSANPRKYKDDMVSEVKDYMGSKIKIKYYLYIDDDKDVIHSISLSVPENFTAYEVMKLAEAEDQKYKFEEKHISGKIYIYKLAKITNDPEAGKFWLQYINSSNNGTDELTHLSESLDKIILKDGQHLIMWYKTAHI